WVSENLKALLCLKGQSSGLAITFQRLIGVCKMQIERGNPILVAFAFESLLRQAQDLERLREPSHLQKCDAVKRLSLCLFRQAADLFELLSRAAGQVGGLS